MRIVFMGTPEAAVPTLERLLLDKHDVVAVYTQPDRPSGRGNKITMSPVKLAAVKNNIPVYQPLKIRSQETLEQIQAHNADVAVVVAYGRILPPAILNLVSETGDKRTFLTASKISRCCFKLGHCQWRIRDRCDDNVYG